MRPMLAMLRLRPVWFSLLALVLVLAYETWLGQGEARKLRWLPPGGGMVAADVVLVLPFDPEPFHMAVLQDAGRLVKVDGRHVFLRDVPIDELHSLARRYWISRIAHWSGQGAP